MSGGTNGGLMAASAFAPMQFVRIKASGLTGYVIGKIEGEVDVYSVQIGHYQKGMTIELWRELSVHNGPCATAEYKADELTPITEDSNEKLHSGKKRRA
jgi:hypothetical protein